MKRIVAHSIYPSYLFITGSWIYSQLTGIREYDNIVLTSSKKNMDIFPFEKVYSISDCNKFRREYYKKYRRVFKSYYPFSLGVLKRNEVSLIHSHFGDVGWEDLKVKQKLKIPQVTTFYGYDVSQLPREKVWRKRYKDLFEKCDVFTAEGKYMKNTLVELGCKEEKVIVQHLGVDLDKIEFIPRRIGEDNLINILVAGTFREKKGIPYAVEAFAKVASKHKNIRLTIIGDGQFGKELLIKDEIMNLIKRYNLSEKVKLLGYQPYNVLLEEAQKQHIFISPSVQATDGDNEGGAPVTIIEMSASGMPVVSTWHCDIPGVIIDGKSGFLAQERNVDELVDRLNYLVENPEMWIQFGQYGRKHIEENFDICKQVDKQCNIYNTLFK